MARPPTDLWRNTAGLALRRCEAPIRCENYRTAAGPRERYKRSRSLGFELIGSTRVQLPWAGLWKCWYSDSGLNFWLLAVVQHADSLLSNESCSAC